MLGAFAEYERAKIIERTMRGKELRLAQGQLLGCGVHMFGYDYVRKTPTSRPQMIVNQQEAEVVRYVFETYANTPIGLDKIAQHLEENGALTRTGKNVWRNSFLKSMLRNETYTGVKYFNKMRTVREYANPIYDIKHSTKKNFPRKREGGPASRCPQLSPASSSTACRSASQQSLPDHSLARFRNP